MADEKLDLKKPGSVLPYLGNFQMSKDGESFHFTELNLAHKNVD